jgi:very-short-patch-repair endonuclease
MCTGPSPFVRTYAALRSDGSSRRSVAAQTASGDLRHVRRGIYATAGTCTPTLAAAAHGGALACESAARHLGLWVLDDPDRVHVRLHRGGHRYAHDGCRCIEHWDRGGATDAFGLPAVERILVQILQCRGIEAMFVALESALRKRMLPSHRRAALRAAVPAAVQPIVDFGRNDADSGLESLVRLRLRRHGLSVRTQVRVPGVGRIDLIIGERLLIEVDGKAGHADATSRHKDLVRDAHAAMWDYDTLRFDYAMVVHDWDLVERAILSRVAAGRHLR